MKNKFNLICRWSFPQSYGGVAMHNYYLLKAIYRDIQCEIISIESKKNSTFYMDSNVKYRNLSLNRSINNMHQIKFSILKNASRFLSDRYISMSFEKTIKNYQEFLNLWTYIPRVITS